MSEAANRRLFAVLMFWTGVTTIFTWLPLVRILGRPTGYTWSILGLSGSGTEGPFWIFLPALFYVLVLLYSAFRGPRLLFYPLLLGWHFALAAIVSAGLAMEGGRATWQGQGLHFSIPLWVIAVLLALLLGVVVAWILSDRRRPAPEVAPWSRDNSIRLAGSLGLLIVALLLFGGGTNYDWVTAAAILATIAHWILLMQSFAHGSGR